MKRAALYVRQSKADDQGIARQLERTRALAELRGWTVAGEYVDDGHSASKARGSGTAWARMLADADAGLLEVVIAVDLDRLLRTTRDLNVLIDHGLAALTLDGELDLTTADGEFRATMLASIARFEVRRKGERQSRANAQRAAGGGVPKGVRLTGYTTDGTVIEEEAAQVRALFAGFDAGETIKGLAESSGLTRSTVRTILTNPRYAGRRRYLGEVVGQGSWLPIVEGAVFDRVTRRLADPSRLSNRSGSTARKHLGSGLYLCGDCDARGIRSTMQSAGSGARYACRACGLSRRIAPVDEYVIRVLDARLRRPDARGAFAPVEDANGAEAAARALRERRAGLLALAADGTFSAEQVREAAADLDRQLEVLDRLIAPRTTPVTPEEVSAGIGTLSTDRLRALIEAVMTVRLLRAPRGVRSFDPATVGILWHGSTTENP